MKASEVHQKIGILGLGNIGQLLLATWIESQVIEPQQVWVHTRSQEKLKVAESNFKVHIAPSIEALIEAVDILWVALKPQDIETLLEPMRSVFHDQHQIVSLAAGVTIKQLRKLLPQVGSVVRVMPNTPARFGMGVSGVSFERQPASLKNSIEILLKPLGSVVVVPESPELEALTVACGSGVGFCFELMMYIQDWLEDHGFDSTTAGQLAAEVFRGAGHVAAERLQQGVSLPQLLDQVTSKGGVTQAGLQSIRENEIERLLRLGLEQAWQREQELGQR